MNPRPLFTAFALLALGCGDSPTVDPVVDLEEPAGPQTTATEPTCDLRDVADHAEMSAGALMRLSLPPETSVVEVRSPGWQQLAADTFRAPHDPQLGELTLLVDCGEAQVEHSVSVELIPPTWSRIPAAGPPAREHAVMWVDDADPNSLYLFGGYLFAPTQFTPALDMWRLDLEAQTWTEVTQSGELPQTAGEIAPTFVPGVSFYLGGQDDVRGEMPTSIARVQVDGDRATWTRPQLDEHIGLQLGALIYDAPRDRHLWAGGLLDDGEDRGMLPTNFLIDIANAGTSTVDLGVLEVESSAPTNRYGMSWAIDPIADRLIVFSGAGAGTASDPVNAATDTWAVDLGAPVPAWTKIEPSGDAPVKRRNGCHAYDPVGHRMFVFGGTADGRTSVEGVQVLDLDAGHERWSSLEFPDGPSRRASCTGVYDALRERVLFGFGNGEGGVYSDVWALELGATRTASAPGPMR